MWNDSIVGLGVSAWTELRELRTLKRFTRPVVPSFLLAGRSVVVFSAISLPAPDFVLPAARFNPRPILDRSPMPRLLSVTVISRRWGHRRRSEFQKAPRFCPVPEDLLPPVSGIVTCIFFPPVYRTCLTLQAANNRARSAFRTPGDSPRLDGTRVVGHADSVQLSSYPPYWRAPFYFFHWDRGMEQRSTIESAAIPARRK
jgi:hypothetical protein